MNNIEQTTGYDILAIGSPLLDVTIYIDDAHLEKLDFRKGSMNLISKEESEAILRELDGQEKDFKPGGSAANTLSGVNLLGNHSAFMGTIGDDEHGRLYSSFTEKEGIVSHLSITDAQSTGHALVLITPDGERTMLTHLGAALSFDRLGDSKQRIANSKILHIEAYQLENPQILPVLKEAIEAAKSGGAKISLDLSDAGLISRNKELFKEIVREHVDILFANEAEALEFTGKHEEEALHEMAEHCSVAVVKLGGKGSLIKHDGEVHRFEPYQVEMINTNGAGDMYAAGILHGLIKGLDIKTAGEIASHVSALVVSSHGGRMDQKHLDEIAKYK